MIKVFYQCLALHVADRITPTDQTEGFFGMDIAKADYGVNYRPGAVGKRRFGPADTFNFCYSHGAVPNYRPGKIQDAGYVRGTDGANVNDRLPLAYGIGAAGGYFGVRFYIGQRM